MSLETSESIRESNLRRLTVAVCLMLALMLLSAPSALVSAQDNPLSLADILTALRSKKASLPDRNRLLSEAVTNRGTTFSVNHEIEKELSATGADVRLIESIRLRGSLVKTSAVVSLPAEAAVPTQSVDEQAPENSAFYTQRAEANRSNGDLDSASADYTRAIELDGANITALLARGALYHTKGSYTLAIADYSRVIELDAQNALAYTRRAEANEKKANPELAIADLTKVLEIAPNDAAAASALLRLRSATAKPVEGPAVKTVITPPTPPAITAVAIPDFIDLGPLSENRAIRMVKPRYPAVASTTNAFGNVVVEVEMDEQGNVTAAKVKSGNPFLRQSAEDAARRSKFKPAMFGEQAVRSRGTIVYNFVSPR